MLQSFDEEGWIPFLLFLFIGDSSIILCICMSLLTLKPGATPQEKYSGKHDPDNDEEMEDIIDLLSEELNLLRNVTHDNLKHTKASILKARNTSSQYQKEAEKCNTGMETCEEAREKAEATLIAERHLSELWERRDREREWKDKKKPYS
ncbi:hypothetical protein NE237_016005 [Protea cynaroides]|uniref:Uncharacterized protein n=1 Tax=Protea cynaroides TaxID=273540 RepID=A0A9Q0KF51_9MAGN|nr:hypothetical protein NE237_016005 [Protea cynaroides]